MKKLMIATAMAGVTALTGCAGVGFEELEDETVSLVGEEKIFEIQTDLPGGKSISDNMILNKLEDNLVAASSVATVEEVAKRLGPANDHRLRGLEIKRSPGAIDVSFVRGKVIANQRSSTDMTATYSVKLEPYDEGTRVIVHTPDHLFIDRNRDGAFAEIDQLIATERATDDIYRMNENLAPQFHFDTRISGEVESPWEPQSVRDNFKRVLGGGEEQDQYMIKLDNQRVPVEMQVFSYRDGSKVSYKMTYSYTVNSDGTTTYQQADVDQVVERIRQVAND